MWKNVSRTRKGGEIAETKEESIRRGPNTDFNLGNMDRRLDSLHGTQAVDLG